MRPTWNRRDVVADPHVLWSGEVVNGAGIGGDDLPRANVLVERSFETPVTLQEIGDRYGISRERVRQVEKNIIKKMSEFFKKEIPDFASYTEDGGAD